MAKAPAPQPATELFSESLQLSLKQREVLDALQAFPQGAGSAELAATLGMHVNTARGHLDELVARGAVRVSSLPAEGRGRRFRSAPQTRRLRPHVFARLT